MFYWCSRHIDIDECADMTDTCDDSLAICTNTVGSFMCTCIAGYSGNGVTCEGIVRGQLEPFFHNHNYRY